MYTDYINKNCSNYYTNLAPHLGGARFLRRLFLLEFPTLGLKTILQTLHKKYIIK